MIKIFGGSESGSRSAIVMLFSNACVVRAEVTPCLDADRWRRTGLTYHNIHAVPPPARLRWLNTVVRWTQYELSNCSIVRPEERSLASPPISAADSRC